MGYTYLATLLETMAKDPAFMNVAYKLNTYSKSNPAYIVWWNLLNQLYKTKYNKPGLNFQVCKSNQQVIYNYELSPAQVINLIRQPFPELQLALNHHTCNKIKSFDAEEKKRISVEIQGLLTKGYGLDERFGFVSGSRERYLAKVFYRRGMFPTPNTIIFKLSQNVKK
uniref:Uncharacterized protein n=1 Tax=viral metagenome TaxID=1070528 RepID=A0A6C0I399_9ZZZZ